MNNSNRTHEFVDLIARVSADKGVLFDFVNNQKLRESGFAMSGATVNGYVTKDGITLNIQSAKALNKVVGHEITHVLEGTELYDALQDAVIKYAQSKGEYDSRLQDITELYKKHDPDADPVKELTADLVGDYLFTDTEFINNLSANHRNVFQKMYDEVKYLCKVATAGSKEARQLEKVKKAFGNAYRTETKNPTTDGGVKLSLYSRPNFTESEWVIVNRRKHSEFDNPKYDLDENTKWMYANEKGSTVFAVYSKHDADDPTVLYGSRGETATKDYEKVVAHVKGGRNANRGRRALDRLLANIQRNEGYRSNGIADTEGTLSATGDVSIPFEESGSNRGRNFTDGSENLRESQLTEYDTEASELSDASSVTWSNDYAAIRNFVKEGDAGEIAPIGGSVDRM